MPRNNRNKNRNRIQQQAAGGASKSTSTVLTRQNESDQKAEIISAGIEAAENTKSALAEAKDKLEQLQNTVTSIQVSINQGKEKATENVEGANRKDSKTPEEQKLDSAETPFESQTLRKKRNRNRNRKKNGAGTVDSGASSTTGTHESSPNVPNVVAIDQATSVSNKTEDKSEANEANSEKREPEEKIVETQNFEKTTVEISKEHSNEDLLVNIEVAIPGEIASDFVATPSTNLETPIAVETTDRDTKKSPKANKKQNRKGANATNKSDEAKKQIQEKKIEKSEEKDILNENKIVESVRSEEPPKDIPPQNDPLPKLQEHIQIQEPIQTVKDLICLEAAIEHKIIAEAQPKPDVLQASIDSDESEKNQSPKEHKNAKNNRKSQKNQQKTEIKPESKAVRKQEAKIESSKPKQELNIVQETNAVNIAHETPTPTASKPNEKIAELKLTEENAFKLEKLNESVTSDKIVAKQEKKDKNEKLKEPLSEKKDPKKNVEKQKSQTSTSSSPLLLPDRSLTKTQVAMKPVPETIEPVKTPVRKDDETAKIWKILEEASKSLEPVEIQMEDNNANSPTKAEEPPPITAPPIAITPSDEIEAKKAAQNLMALLDTKEPTTTQTKEMKPEHPKSTTPKKKEKSPIISQPRQSPESAKKEKKSEKKQPEESPPPIVEHTPSVDTEIPLDMSIISNANVETPETNTNSKNVQGSDFVPSVEQSAVVMKSLGTEELANAIESLECTKKEETMLPMNKETTKTVNNSKHSTPKSAENFIKAPKGKSSSPPEGKKIKQVDHRKVETTICKTAQKKPDINANTHGKKALHQQKSSKPNIPPKPDHLVCSNSKKPAEKQPTQNEMKLVLGDMAENDEDVEENYIEYKFMPRQVFIAAICQSCKMSTTSDNRIYCKNCKMVSYCCKEHRAADDPLHKDFCTAIQEIAKKRGGHVYNNARILNNNDYRSLRVHTLNLCENFLKRSLQTYEREILLFPRLCSMPTCREWRQEQLTDCPDCTQAYYCTLNPNHLNETHKRWCKSVALYRKLVVTQSISGRIEPTLPSRIVLKPYTLPNNIEQVFQDLYKNYSAIKDECVFATVTQLATAPLTAYFAAQKSELKIGEKFTIHLVGAELQFEADILDIWETFFLHLSHKLVELTIVFCGPELNAENIPLDIISRIRMCRTCRQNCRIVKFDFQCAKLYHDYVNSSAYKTPNLICFFNPGFHHISYNGMDTWSETIKNAANAGCPVIVTSYTEYESPRDLERFQKEMGKIEKPLTLIHGPSLNAYSSQRPERNFISDEVTPLIFKNFFCFIMK